MTRPVFYFENAQQMPHTECMFFILMCHLWKSVLFKSSTIITTAHTYSLNNPISLSFTFWCVTCATDMNDTSNHAAY